MIWFSVTWNYYNSIIGVKLQLNYSFEIGNLDLHFFFGVQVMQLGEVIFISQPIYKIYLFNGFNMEDYEPWSTPFQIGF